jgi:hypothetical protein
MKCITMMIVDGWVMGYGSCNGRRFSGNAASINVDLFKTEVLAECTLFTVPFLG